jgi:hypothetical protein
VRVAFPEKGSWKYPGTRRYIIKKILKSWFPKGWREEVKYCDWCEMYKEGENGRAIEEVNMNECDECHQETLEHMEEGCDPILCMWEGCPNAWGDWYG